MEVLEWSRLYNGWGTDEYPELFKIEADSLSSAIEVASDFPIGQKNSSNFNCYPAFEVGKTFIPESGIIFSADSQVAAFVLKSESSVVGGIKIREAIFILKKDSEPNTWKVRCAKTIRMSSGNFSNMLLLKQIDENYLFYSNNNSPAMCNI